MSRYGIKVKDTHQDVTITLVENVKFRVIPPPEFDAKGRLKPFKPDPKDPDRKWGGVKGTADDLKRDVWVVADLKQNRAGSKHVANVVVVLGREEDEK